jgi:hypothetical protein
MRKPFKGELVQSSQEKWTKFKKVKIKDVTGAARDSGVWNAKELKN